MGLRDGLKRRATGAARRVKRVIVGGDSGPSNVPRPLQATRVEAAAKTVTRPAEGAPPESQPTATPSVISQKLKMAVTKDETLTDEEKVQIRERAIDAMRTIFDPEIPVNIWELGLIYGVEVLDDRTVDIKMTLTSPNCPAAQSLPVDVKEKTEAVEGVASAEVEIVFEPPWTMEKMDDAAKLVLNIL
jgi:FeS assembly SUF system protein